MLDRKPLLKAKIKARKEAEKKRRLRGIKSAGGRRRRLIDAKGLGYLKGSRVAGSKNDEKVKNIVFKKPVRSWRDPMRTKWTKWNKRKPSRRGLSKSQIKLIATREKQRKLAHRRK